MLTLDPLLRSQPTNRDYFLDYPIHFGQAGGQARIGKGMEHISGYLHLTIALASSYDPLKMCVRLGIIRHRAALRHGPSYTDSVTRQTSERKLLP